MRKRIHNAIIAMAIITGSVYTFPAWSFPTSKFTSISKLSEGKWVKIAVASDGMYQITAEQLAEMGFNNPGRVQMYGQGGHALNEIMSGSASDDLTAVPVMQTEDKIIFYGQGPVGKRLVDYTSSMPYYLRTRNAYSNYGYYFLTESDTPTRVTMQAAQEPGTTPQASSYNLFLHEEEQTSLGETGKRLLGEDLMPSGTSIDYYLPQRCDSSITVRIEAAAYITGVQGYVRASITSGGEEIDIPYLTSESKISAVNNDPQRHYRTASPTRSIKLNDTQETGQLNVGVYTLSGNISTARLDYAAITFKRTNTYDNITPYFAMGYPMIAAETQVTMPDVDSTTVVWDVTDPLNLRQMSLRPAIDENGDTLGMGFTPGRRTAPSEFIAFMPAGQLKEISGFSEITNQNLHSLRTPDMLIVTNQYFMAEAERLAQLHRDHDGMTVHVVDQEQVFNEFSSGTPDAMAIRLFCKMLYDRNETKFKYLLMFGPASFDYRGITTDKPYRVITFETDESDSDASSYGTDDFFGILRDNTGGELTYDMLCLGVGRIPASDLTQARQAVDKVAHYVLNPDYGPWRNHYMVWADTPVSKADIDLHGLQAEGIDDLIQNELQIPMVPDKAYVGMFPLEGSSASEARRHVADMLAAGQYYGTYVGHASTKSFTSHRMWSISNVQSQSYEHQPIFMTACCDVARYDGNGQGIAELMFHQPNGGAIALLTSSREVEATRNDNLNRAFTQAMFAYNTTGQMTTLGEAYMKAKQSQLVRSDLNKMSFLLLGDPAIKVQYPKPLFRITDINGMTVGVDTIGLAPLQQVTVRAQVMRPGDSQVNTNFNGDAMLSIYDARKFFKHGVYNGYYYTVEGDMYYPRDLLVEVQGRVENGMFTGTAILPRYIKAQPGDTLAVHVYAHQDNSAEMVNGSTTQLIALTYNDSLAVTDDTPPVIDMMYLNEKESFEQGIPVPPTSTLYVKASDDVSFNNQSMGIGSSVKLTLDGGKTIYQQVKDYTSMTDDGRVLQIKFPIAGLSEGKHTLTLSVQDVCGNYTERSIDFMVSETSNITIKANDLVAINEAIIDLGESDAQAVTTMTIKAVDAQGRLVWSTSTSSMPCTWDLTDSQGNRVPDGLYKVFGQYNDGTRHGGTNISPIIVMSPIAPAGE